MPALRPSFLDHVPAPDPRETQAGRSRRTSLVVNGLTMSVFTLRYKLQDDPDDDPDEDDDFDEDDEGDDEDDENEEDVETWQVSKEIPFP
jgi:hypothetical protein